MCSQCVRALLYEGMALILVITDLTASPREEDCKMVKLLEERSCLACWMTLRSHPVSRFLMAARKQSTSLRIV